MGVAQWLVVRGTIEKAVLKHGVCELCCGWAERRGCQIAPFIISTAHIYKEDLKSFLYAMFQQQKILS